MWRVAVCDGTGRAPKSLNGQGFVLTGPPCGPPGGTFSSPPRYLGMTEDLSFRRKPLTPEQRQARDAARRLEAEKAMRDHEEAQKAFYANRERLKAERLAREAAAGKD
ncbi:hypothetical protein ACVMAJ_000309 [Bradyrhizobium sp. USDA 4448]